MFQRIVPLGIEAYPAFVFSGLLPWSWFSASISGAAGLFVGRADPARFGHPPTSRRAPGPAGGLALRDVSFEVEQGCALGIIGHNGAGKSTLLRLLCGISLPTRGRVTHVGPVTGLLELGGGFHVECTGRQNLMTAGLLTGLTAAEVRAREDAIVAFAELEEAIDRPVRTYSGGMFLRLAFAAAVHFDPNAAGPVSGVLDVHPRWFVGSKELVPQGHRARGS